MWLTSGFKSFFKKLESLAKEIIVLTLTIALQVLDLYSKLILSVSKNISVNHKIFFLTAVHGNL